MNGAWLEEVTRLKHKVGIMLCEEQLDNMQFTVRKCWQLCWSMWKAIQSVKPGVIVEI